MNETLHITSGDVAGDCLAKTGIAGEVFVWHDILYDGFRRPGWPDDEVLDVRARFLEGSTGGGLERTYVLDILKKQYQKLGRSADYNLIVLWFDACLFDQSMLAHILTCLPDPAVSKTELLCIDTFPSIVPFNGLGQLNPSQLASLYDKRRPVTDAQFQFAKIVDRAFANQNQNLFAELSHIDDAPLPCVPAAVRRWLQEQPDPKTGFGRLETLALKAIREGSETPGKIFAAVAKADTPPQYWGDITLWAKINGLANRKPPLVKIEGPAKRLPQWEGKFDLKRFRVYPIK
jgi:hypothetical protein